MALVKCIECGGQISDTAPICPHCGKVPETPALTDTKEGKNKSTIKVLAILGLIFGLFSVLGVLLEVEYCLLWAIAGCGLSGVSLYQAKKEMLSPILPTIALVVSLAGLSIIAYQFIVMFNEMRETEKFIYQVF